MRERVTQLFDYDISGICVSGVLDVYNWKGIFVSLHMCIPVIPFYAAILIVRRAIMKKLNVCRAISEKTKHMHSQLLKVSSFKKLNAVHNRRCISKICFAKLAIMLEDSRQLPN